LSRRIVLGTVVVIAIGCAIGWRFLASTESCLVGSWRVTESTSFPKAGTLELKPDGAAILTEFQESPYAAIWKSTREHLEVTLVSRSRPDLEEPADPGLSWRLQWKILEKTPDVLRLEGPVNGNWPSGLISLARQ
jgi:hypothetical protein